MPTNHTIEQGETTIGLSEEFGLFTDTIWNDPANASLKQLRQDMNVLLPGDVLVIPDLRLKEVTKPDAKKHRFKRKGVPAKFRLQVFDGELPRANQKYQLVIDGKSSSGAADGQGVLELYVPPQAQEGLVRIGPDNFQFTLRFGHLNPISDITGVQNRLANLGFLDQDAVSGEWDDATKSALGEFQTRFQLPVTGQADQATRDKLQAVYDRPGKFPPAPAET